MFSSAILAISVNAKKTGTLTRCNRERWPDATPKAAGGRLPVGEVTSVHPWNRRVFTKIASPNRRGYVQGRRAAHLGGSRMLLMPPPKPEVDGTEQREGSHRGCLAPAHRLPGRLVVTTLGRAPSPIVGERPHITPPHGVDAPACVPGRAGARGLVSYTVCVVRRAHQRGRERGGEAFLPFTTC